MSDDKRQTPADALAIQVGPNQGVMCVMNMSGDSKTIWDRTVPFEVEQARAQFDTFRKKGYMAYKVQGDGERGEVIHTFDPEAQKIIFAPPMKGGIGLPPLQDDPDNVLPIRRADRTPAHKRDNEIFWRLLVIAIALAFAVIVLVNAKS